MQLSDMRSRVAEIIQDTSFSDARINAEINAGIRDTAARVFLPSLKRIGTITTALETNTTTLSSLTNSTYLKVLRVRNSLGNTLPIIPTIEDFFDRYSNCDLTSEGAVESVVIEATTMWYYKVPSSAETLTLLYYSGPTELSLDTSEPTDFPTPLHEELFVNFAAWKIWSLIEDGIDGAKINTSFYERRYNDAVSKLRNWIGGRTGHYISSVWSH